MRRTKSAKKANATRDSARRSPTEPLSVAGPLSKPVVVPVTSEELALGKRVETTKVWVRKVVQERVVDVDESIIHDEVIVERVPIDRLITEPIPPRHEGNTLVLSVIEEIVVKQLRLVEEVRITKERRVDRRTAAIPLRREEIVVERGRPTSEHTG